MSTTSLYRYHIRYQWDLHGQCIRLLNPFAIGNYFHAKYFPKRILAKTWCLAKANVQGNFWLIPINQHDLINVVIKWHGFIKTYSKVLYQGAYSKWLWLTKILSTFNKLALYKKKLQHLAAFFIRKVFTYFFQIPITYLITSAKHLMLWPMQTQILQTNILPRVDTPFYII